MKNKNRIAMLLATTMALSVLAGCGADNTTTSSSGSSGSASSADGNQQNTDFDQALEVTENPVTFPLSDAMDFTFHYHARNKYVFDPTWPVFEEMASLTNVTFTNTGNEVGTNSDTEISLEQAKQYPSAIYGGNNTATYYMSDGPLGAFFPLNDYWEYMPNFYSYLQDNPDVAATIVAGDGNIYHLPYIAEGGVARTYHIRQDWLDILGLEMPETTEQLEEVLIAFRDGDPNGNSLADEVPYFNDKYYETYRLVNLWGARCYASDTYTERVIPTEDGDVYHAWLTDEFKYALENLSRWYDMGLVDQEFASKNNDARPTYLPGNTGGMTHEWVASTSSYNYTVDVDGFNFITMAPPVATDVNGNTVQFEEHQRIKVKPDGWAISTNAGLTEEEVGVIFAYMDYFWCEEGRILSNWGVEGLQWEYVDGVPTFLPEVLDGSATEGKAVNSYLEEDVGAQLKHGYWQDYEYEFQWTSEIGQAGVLMYETNGYSDDVMIMPTLNYTADENKIYEAYISTVNDKLDEWVQKFVMGPWEDIDGQWATYVAEVEATGVEILLDNYRSAYSRYVDAL